MRDEVYICMICEDWQIDAEGLPLRAATVEEPGAHVAGAFGGVAYQAPQFRVVRTVWADHIELAIQDHIVAAHLVPLARFFMDVDRLTTSGETATLRRELRLAIRRTRGVAR